MINYYKLEDKKVVPCSNVLEWGKFFEDFKSRRVAKTVILPGIMVSTMFLGMHISHDLVKETPQIFETMIFGGDHDGWSQTHSTWDEAEKEHNEICRKIRDQEPL